MRTSMNDLERAILRAAQSAHRRYEAISGGWWLGHAPEFFLTTYVGNHIARKGWAIYLDASPKKINTDEDGKKRGRRPGNIKKRFDIVVWNKSSDDIRAITAVQRAWEISPLVPDSKKVRTQAGRSKAGTKSGYMLVYSDAKRLSGGPPTKTLDDRFDHWKRDLKSRSFERAMPRQTDKEWVWDIALIRLF